MIQQIHLHCRKKAVLVQLFASSLHITATMNRGEEIKEAGAGQLQMTAFNSLMSQFCPVQPGMHSQKYPPIRLRHELALSQGLLSHSLASSEGERERVCAICMCSWQVWSGGKKKRGQAAHLSDTSFLSTVKDSDTCSRSPDPGRFPRDCRGLESSRQCLSRRSQLLLFNKILFYKTFHGCKLSAILLMVQEGPLHPGAHWHS